MIADTPYLIRGYRMLALKGALKLQSLGLPRRSHRQSALSIVNGLGIGIKARTAKAALPLFEAYLKSEGILR